MRLSKWRVVRAAGVDVPVCRSCQLSVLSGDPKLSLARVVWWGPMGCRTVTPVRAASVVVWCRVSEMPGFWLVLPCWFACVERARESVV